MSLMSNKFNEYWPYHQLEVEIIESGKCSQWPMTTNTVEVHYNINKTATLLCHFILIISLWLFPTKYYSSTALLENLFQAILLIS